jgi:hypothetical protein
VFSPERLSLATRMCIAVLHWQELICADPPALAGLSVTSLGRVESRV